MLELRESTPAWYCLHMTNTTPSPLTIATRALTNARVKVEAFERQAPYYRSLTAGYRGPVAAPAHVAAKAEQARYVARLEQAEAAVVKAERALEAELALRPDVR